MTDELVERLKAELTPQLQGYLAKTAGESPAATSKAIATALSTIGSGITKVSATPSGLSSIARLVSDPVNDGTLLNQLPALYQGTMTGAPIYRLGSQLLHQVFGSKLGTINQSIATLAGIRPSSAAMLTSTLAPHVLAALGQQQRASGETGASALAALLGVSGASSAASVGASGASGGSQPSPTRANAAEKTSTVAAGSVAGSTQASRSKKRSGGDLWALFPIGLAVAGGLLVAWVVVSNQTQEVPTAREDRVSAGPKSPVTPTYFPVTNAEPTAKTVFDSAPAGTTTYFGSGPSAPEKPVVFNPDYTPGSKAIAAAIGAMTPAPEPERKPGPPGTTSFFGITPAAGDRPAVPNPDYKPLAPVVVAAPPPPLAPVPERRPGLPGTTTFFGTAPTPADKPVFVNPDYKPATPVVVASSAVAAAPATAPAPVKPAAPSAPPGVTSYFGTSPRVPDLPVVMNPDYKPVSRVASSAGRSKLDVAACAAAVDAAAKSGRIRFSTARAVLTRSSKATLERVASAFKRCGQGHLVVGGHTDDRGSAVYNLRLSERRARSVATFLGSRGVSKSRLSAKGFGLAKPVVPNTSVANMAKNRRIEISVE